MTYSQRIRICLRQIIEKYKISGGLIVPSSNNEDINNQLLIDKTTEFLLSEILSGFRVGVGWGSTIGGVAERISNLPTSLKLSGEIIAMIGNAPTSNRNYHTNELVRMLLRRQVYVPSISTHRSTVIRSQRKSSLPVLKAIRKSIGNGRIWIVPSSISATILQFRIWLPRPALAICYKKKKRSV
jgi:hypothetical protein